ncbi:DUF3500 domain-containing protein [Haloferula chungangensis]|uniref:DUF3500 domain-containing protein n=1 Tax=Haloferula chungangensis TaxID=1048331 RepID=A0ABW2LB95_9BACT
MKATLSLILLAAFLNVSSGLAGTHKAWTLTGEVFAAAEPAETDHSPKAMVAAAEALLAKLTSEQRKQLLLPIDDPERREWRNVPPDRDDGGLRLGDLNREQLESACAFLSTVMSRSGYLKVRNIMLADDLLLRSEKQANRRGGFGSANFWIAIFGTPSETKPWGVQWDGHHVAINLSIVGEKITMSPSFIGTQPHRFMLGNEEIIPMKGETASGYRFIGSLSEEQRKEAIQGARRANLMAGAGKDGKKPKLTGMSCGGLSPEQRTKLMKLIAHWVNDLPKAAAEVRLKEIEAQLDQTVFAWNGPYNLGSDMSYHLSGPGVIIEYSGQDLGGDPLDHLHSIYRDPSNEYGVKWSGKE